MSKRACLHLLLAVLTAIAATVAMLIGWTDPHEHTTALTHVNGETIQGKATP